MFSCRFVIDTCRSKFFFVNTTEKLETKNVYHIFVGDRLSQFSRLNNWRDVGEGDIKIFLAHLIAMGLVRKGAIERYWDHGGDSQDTIFWNVHGT